MMTTTTHPFGNVYDGHPSCCTAEHIKTRSSDADTERDVHEVYKYKCVKLAEFVNRPPEALVTLAAKTLIFPRRGSRD